MARSTIPAVKAALETRFDADTAVDATLSRGHPFPDTPPGQHVIIGKAISIQEPGPFGQQARDENYTVDLWIQVVQPSARARFEALEVTAYDIAGAIEDSVRAWATEAPQPFGGVVGSGWILVSAMEDGEGLRDGASRSCTVKLTLACRARI